MLLIRAAMSPMVRWMRLSSSPMLPVTSRVKQRSSLGEMSARASGQSTTTSRSPSFGMVRVNCRAPFSSRSVNESLASAASGKALGKKRTRPLLADFAENTSSAPASTVTVALGTLREAGSRNQN
ncbi:hypothetical protein D3C86_1605220 [compost metagenome]